MRKLKKALCFLLTFIMCLSPAFQSVANNTGNNIEVNAATKLTEDDVYRYAPEYLNNEAYNKIITLCRGYSDEAMDSVTEWDERFAAYFFGLKEGADFLWNEMCSAAGLTDSTYDTFQKDVAKKIVYDYLSVDQGSSKASKKVSKQFSYINKAYDLTKKAEQDAFKTEMKRRKYIVFSDEQIDDQLDKLYANTDKIYKYVGTAFELTALVVGILEMYYVEVEAIDDLIDIANNSKDKSLYNALIEIRADRTSNPAEYIVATYLTDKALGKISGIVKKALKDLAADELHFEASSFAWGVGKLICKGVAFIYENVNVSVDDIVSSTVMQQYCNSSSAAVGKIYMRIRNGAYDEDTIQLYAAAIDLEAVCTKLLLGETKKIAKKKHNDSLYSKLNTWEQSMGSTINYQMYIESCVANAQKAADSGLIVINNETVTKKDQNGNVIDENYDSTESIRTKFEAIQAQYQPNVGQTWNGNWGGCIQCFGFARMVFSNLYGCEMPSSYASNARYKYTNEYNVGLVGQLSGGEVTVDAVKSLMLSGKLGDIIQASGATYGQHTMVFVSASDSEVVVYDCNAHLNSSEPDCVIHQWNISYATIASWYGSSSAEMGENGISLYRASNYAEIYGDGVGMFYDDSVNFVIENGVLKKYNGWQTVVYIPDTVTEIGSEAFKNKTAIQAAIIERGKN